MLSTCLGSKRRSSARSFFRLFAHKSDVFFCSLKTTRQEAVAHITAAPEGTTLVDAVAAALGQCCTVIQQYPASALARQTVIAANAELRERT